MASRTTSPCLIFLLALLLPLAAVAVPRRHRFPSLQLAPVNASEPPTTFFEVDRPIQPPRGSVGPCSALLLSDSFGYTYGRPPATAFDRIFGVWLSGAELLRSCTAEPRPDGILWSVSRDVTRYAALLSEPGEVAVYLGNIVDSTYTGVYHANLTLHLYFHSTTPSPPPLPHADLILPISRSLPLNDGQWFAIQNSADVQSRKLAIPSNTYRAVLEVFVSFHSSDEFWYTNPPNEYIEANNLSSVPGNGAFREVIVKVDDNVVGAVWPFTVIYTGGVNPLLWRPITGIGSFNLPTYDIDITPFLGKLMDGKEHNFGFAVTNALDMWYIDANLHLWLDHKSKKTVGSLISYDATSSANVDSQFSGLDGRFVTSASRHVSATGWVESSHGKVMTTFYQRFSYKNSNVYSKNGSEQVVNQTIDAKSGVSTTNGAVLLSEEVHQVFPLYLFSGTSDEVGDEYSLVSAIKLSINEKRGSGAEQGFSYSSLRNAQSARGSMRVKGNLVTSGSGENHQVYKYVGTDGCYSRDVSSKNYTIVFDHSDDSCLKGSQVKGSRFPSS
uniref:Peptide N-acetyl-beta-D-glucosaminyl asparaginase amidase A N-terminal domain-containing protein n=1 Tax=Aegilops tauschii subsp. strangulata TaxID=200361 RepID=A0A453EFG5_AEGTS